MTTCAHCTKPALNPIVSGTIYGEPRGTYCHPDFGLDCYSLVTISGHDTPCLNCKPIRVEQDQLRRLGQFGRV